MSVYKFGMVNSAHVYKEGELQEDHMHFHVYGERFSRKESKNVFSLINKTLDRLNQFNEEDPGRDEYDL